MIVGIDLGTTNSLIAYYKDGHVQVIPNRLGEKLTPSVVSVDENNTILVGQTAREYSYLDPANSAKVFKRSMGTDRKYQLRDYVFSSEELSSFVLRYLKQDAEAYLKEPVEEAIISVPAYFNDNQRKATKKAGELAGLKVNRIISEPTASAVAYGIGDNNKAERCMVFDLGGGTFDVSILEYFHSIMEVHAIAGDNNLGGEDFTLTLMQLFKDKTGLNDAEMSLLELNNLYKACERAKCDISSCENVRISVKVNDTVYQSIINIDEYEIACQPLLERIRKPIEKSLRDAQVTLDDLDRVILVGGATRLSIVRNFVEKVMKMYPQFYVNPDTSVALGAALQGAMKQRDKSIEEIILTDVCPFTLGTEVVKSNGSFEEAGHFMAIIERNTVIPVSKTSRVYTAHDNQQYVNVKILQGESRLARNNFLLGELSLEVPVGPKGKEAIDITYTYDVNSLLEVEVKIVSTGLVKKVVIQNQENKMSEEEAAKRLELLSYLKLNPREEEENYFALLRGNRLYEESIGQDKEVIEQALFNFEKMLAQGSRIEIERCRKRLLELLDEIEKPDFSGLLA